ISIFRLPLIPKGNVSAILLTQPWKRDPTFLRNAKGPSLKRARHRPLRPIRNTKTSFGYSWTRLPGSTMVRAMRVSAAHQEGSTMESPRVAKWCGHFGRALVVGTVFFLIRSFIHVQFGRSSVDGLSRITNDFYGAIGSGVSGCSFLWLSSYFGPKISGASK